nr:MAG: hypothetical protein [Sanya fiers-like virus 28]
MAAKGNIVINDGQATPVAHTFSPRGPASPDGYHIYEDRVGGIAIGFPLLMFRVKSPSTGAQVSQSNRVYRVAMSIALPTMEVTSPQTGTGIQPAPTVSYVNRASVEYILAERGTLANRKDLNAYVKNFLSNAVWTTAVETFEGVW